MSSLPARPGKLINDQPDLDLMYFEPYVPRYMARQLFGFLREELPFYRVEYSIKRGGVETQIRTPRLVSNVCSSPVWVLFSLFMFVFTMACFFFH